MWAILKRTTAQLNSTNIAIDGTLFITDEASYTISLQEKPLNLTRHEFNLFRYLLSRPKRVFSREQLLDTLGIALDSGYERNIDSHIKALRAKIRDIDNTLDVIRTHRGFGYSYDPT